MAERRAADGCQRTIDQVFSSLAGQFVAVIVAERHRQLRGPAGDERLARQAVGRVEARTDRAAQRINHAGALVGVVVALGQRQAEGVGLAADAVERVDNARVAAGVVSTSRTDTDSPPLWLSLLVKRQ